MNIAELIEALQRLAEKYGEETKVLVDQRNGSDHACITDVKLSPSAIRAIIIRL